MNLHSDELDLVEIFSSIQGEGLYVGCRQVFVRLAGCNICCRYCDTVNSFVTPPEARVESVPGGRIFHTVANPMSMEIFVRTVDTLCQSPHHSISLTGGEPLLQPAVVLALQPIRKAGTRLYLETNGTLPEALEHVIDDIDIVSMDFKLPSAMYGKSFWSEHARFLRIAAKRSVFVKVVLTGETLDEEIREIVELIGSVNTSIPLIFQPVTPVNGVPAVAVAHTLRWQEMALQRLRDVRVIPQTHKIMGHL